MIVAGCRLPYKYGQSIKILPIFDIHFGSAACDIKALKNDLSKIDDDTYIIGGGDWMDMVIATDAKRYRKSGDASSPHEDAIVDEQIELLYEIFKPYEDHVIGIGSGNHEDNIVIRCNTNPSKRLAKMLNTQFLGYSWMVKIILNEHNARSRTVTIRGHHGWGGGSRTVGADLTKFSKDVGYWDADIFLYGHVHKKQSDKIPRLGLSGLQLISRPKLLVLCGTYLKTFLAGESPSYSEKEGYPPIEVGGQIISIKPTSTWAEIKVLT